MLDVVPLRYGTAFKKAFSDPLAFHALVEAAVGIDFMPERVEQEYSYRQPVSRVNVAYDDIDHVAVPALNHRLVLNFAARADDIDPRALIQRLLDAARRLHR